MITIKEDKTNESFKFRAYIETSNGEKLYLILP